MNLEASRERIVVVLETGRAEDEDDDEYEHEPGDS